MTRIISLAALCFLLTAPSAFAQGDVVQTLNELRPLYPTPMSKPQIAELLNRAAQAHPGWMMLRKEGGNTCPTPSGKHISCDWLVNTATQWGYDMLRDQEGVGQPGIFGDGAIAPGTELVLPWDADASAPAPPPATQPGQGGAPQSGQTVNLEPLQTHIDLSIAAAVKVLTDAQTQLLADEVKWRDTQREQYTALLGAVNEPGWFMKIISNRVVQAVGATVVGILTTRQMMKPSTVAVVTP